ncbi:MAG: PqqD family protein [Candidatus Rokubacteria bacterium]|nr:PqqD family protein [Candidatus Rokubacteria bacterium]
MVIRKSPRVAWRTIAGEGVVLSLDTRMLRGLNPVGTRVWELIDGHRAVDDIATEIAREFGVEAERARADVDAFVAELADKHLVEMVHAP